jgi:hypothetical protein
MDKLATIERLAAIKTEIDALNEERKQLQADAVEQGWAKWMKVAVSKTPTLAWYKEQYPRSWEKYITTGSRTEFRWK